MKTGLDACGIDAPPVQRTFNDKGGNIDAVDDNLDLLHKLVGNTSKCSNEMESSFIDALQAFDTCTGRMMDGYDACFFVSSDTFPLLASLHRFFKVGMQ